MLTLSHSEKPWPAASYYYKLAELAWSQEADNLAWSQNGWLFSHSSLSVIACGCDKRFYRPNFQNCSQIKCVYVCVGRGGAGEDLPSIVCLEKGMTLFKVSQEFSCYFILFCEADDKFRCPLPQSDVLLWYFRELASPKEAQDRCSVSALKSMTALLWAQHSAEKGTIAHPGC